MLGVIVYFANSFKIIGNDNFEYDLCKSSIVTMRYSASNNGVTLKSGFGVVAPLDRPHTTDYLSAIVTMALSCIISGIKRDNDQQVRQQDAYLAIRPAYPRGCCPRAAKRIKKLHALLVSLYF